MKRTPLKRKTPLARRTPLRRTNRKRLAKRRLLQFGPQADACRRAHCIGCFAPPPCEPHHILSRGAGGLDADCIPLCRGCHRELHSVGRTLFETRHFVDLQATALVMQHIARNPARSRSTPLEGPPK